MQLVLGKKHWLAGFLVLALCLSAGVAWADDGRKVGDYQVIVGWLDQPAYAGVKNGVELRVTRLAGAQDHHATGTPGAGDGMAMAMPAGEGQGHGAGHEAVEAEAAMSVQLTAEPDPSGGIKVHIQPQGFAFTPESAGMDHVEGEGHAHIYVDGKKIGRAYNPWMHVGGVAPGQHSVRVTLNSNSHGDYTIGGKAVEAAVQVDVPDPGPHGHADTERLAAAEPMEVALRVSPDITDGANIAVLTRGFSFAPENVNKQHVPGEGHAHIYVNGVKIGRMYGPHFHLGGLEDGLNRVRVTLNSNTHQDYTWNGQLVEASALVNSGAGGAGVATESAGENMSHAAATDGHSSGVAGLEETLQVKVTHVGTDASRVVELYPDHGEAGRYTAHFIPAEAGAYQFRVFGSVEREPVNEYFDSGSSGGDLPDVLPSEDLAIAGGRSGSGSFGLATGLAIGALILGGAGFAVAAISLLVTARGRRAG